MANDEPTMERMYRVRDGDGSLLGDFHLNAVDDKTIRLWCPNGGKPITITVDREPWTFTDADLVVHPAKIRSVMRGRTAPTSTEQTG